MKRMSTARLALCLLLLGFMAIPSYASDILWYNGDYDLTPNDPSYLSNQISPSLDHPVVNYRTYDAFVVPTGGWTITTLYSNNFLLNSLSTASITEAYWEIRQGISDGTGGTIALSGTTSLFGTLSVTATDRFFADVYPEVKVAVTNLKFFLDAGQYWLSVTPITSDVNNYIANSLTMGTNAFGIDPANNTNSFVFLKDQYLDIPYANAISQMPESFTGNVDFSMGIEGTAGVAAPLPSSLLLLGSALLALGFYGLRLRAC